LFSQMLFELMGRGRESLTAAAEAYAVVHTDFAEQIATTPAMSETVAPAAEAPVGADAVMPLTAEAIVAGTNAEAPQAEAVIVDAGIEEIATPELSSEFCPDLSIVAGPTPEHIVAAAAEPEIVDLAAELAEVKTGVAAELAPAEAEVKDVVPA
jgi:hypothetical protein